MILKAGEGDDRGWDGWKVPLTHDGHEFGQAPGVGDGQGSLACCSSWGPKNLDMTEWLDWTELNWTEFKFAVWAPWLPRRLAAPRLVPITRCLEHTCPWSFLSSLASLCRLGVSSKVWSDPRCPLRSKVSRNLLKHSCLHAPLRPQCLPVAPLPCPCIPRTYSMFCFLSWVWSILTWTSLCPCGWMLPVSFLHASPHNPGHRFLIWKQQTQ